MIVDAFLDIMATTFATLLGALAVPQPPSWMSSTITGLRAAFEGIYEFSYWLPVGFLAPALLAVFAANAMGFSISVLRMVVSIATGGGGAR